MIVRHGCDFANDRFEADFMLERGLDRLLHRRQCVGGKLLRLHRLRCRDRLGLHHGLGRLRLGLRRLGRRRGWRGWRLNHDGRGRRGLGGLGAAVHGGVHQIRRDHIEDLGVVRLGAAGEEGGTENQYQHEKQMESRRGDQAFFLEPAHLGVGSVRRE